jgi:uncharacterized membrane-anchored protein YhcB (DUF1043 family)
MTKKHQTLYGIIGLVIGIFGGAIGTAFSMGAEKQQVQDAITATNVRIAHMEEKQDTHKTDVEKEMDRYTEIIAAHMTQLQENIACLNTTVGDLRTDVQVLKALMERMEGDLKTMADPG